MTPVGALAMQPAERTYRLGLSERPNHERAYVRRSRRRFRGLRTGWTGGAEIRRPSSFGPWGRTLLPPLAQTLPQGVRGIQRQYTTRALACEERIAGPTFQTQRLVSESPLQLRRLRFPTVRLAYSEN